MGVVQKESIRNTIIYYSGVALGYLNMVIIFPRVFQSDQYGLVRFIFPFAGIMAICYLIGIPSVIIRFFPHLKDKDKRHNGLLFFSLSVMAVGILLFTTVFFIFKPYILDVYSKNAGLFVRYYYVVIPLAIGFAIFEVLSAYNRSLLKTNFAVFLMEVYARIAALLIAIGYKEHFFNFTTFINLYVTAYFSTAVIMIFYTYFNKELYLKPSKTMFKPNFLKQIMNYGLFSFFGGISGTLVDKIDVLFVGGYLGLAETGIYGVAILMASSIALPAKALYQVLSPLTANAFKENDREKLKYLYSSSCSNQLFIGAVFFMLIWINFDPFFTLVHPAFLAAKTAFLILSVWRLFDMATGINGVLIVNSKYYRYDLFFTVMLVVLITICNQLLIPRFGMIGAASATTGAIVVYNVIKYFFVWAKLKLQPFNLETVKILLTILSIFFISGFLPGSGYVIFDMFYKTLVIGLLFLFSLVYLKINPEIFQLVLTGYKKGRKMLPFRRSDVE